MDYRLMFGRTLQCALESLLCEQLSLSFIDNGKCDALPIGTFLASLKVRLFIDCCRMHDMEIEILPMSYQKNSKLYDLTSM